MTIASAPSARDRARRPIDQPCYRASFVEAMRRFVVKYATFSGRAGRAEYWWVALVQFALPFAIQGVTGVLTGDWSEVDGQTFSTAPNAILLAIYLATAVPTLAITWRRLHDANRSGLWAFILFVPFVGWLAFLIFVLTPPRPEGARFDAEPAVATG